MIPGCLWGPHLTMSLCQLTVNLLRCTALHLCLHCCHWSSTVETCDHENTLSFQVRVSHLYFEVHCTYTYLCVVSVSVYLQKHQNLNDTLTSFHIHIQALLWMNCLNLSSSTTFRTKMDTVCNKFTDHVNPPPIPIPMTCPMATPTAPTCVFSVYSYCNLTVCMSPEKNSFFKSRISFKGTKMFS